MDAHRTPRPSPRLHISAALFRMLRCRKPTWG